MVCIGRVWLCAFGTNASTNVQRIPKYLFIFLSPPTDRIFLTRLFATVPHLICRITKYYGWVAGKFQSKRVLSVPKNTGRRVLYKIGLAITRVACVAAAAFWGGQPFVRCII